MKQTESIFCAVVMCLAACGGSAHTTEGTAPDTETSVQPQAANQTAESAGNGATFEGTGYTYSPPAGWQQDTRPKGKHPDSRWNSPPPLTGGRASLQVVIFSAKGVTPERFIEENQSAVEKAFKNVEHSQMTALSVGGLEAKEWTFEGDGDQGVRLKVRNVVVARDGQIYMIAFTTTAASFNDFANSFQTSLESFAWRDEP